MHRYFLLIFVLILALFTLAGCNDETPKDNLPEPVDTVDIVDTTPTDTEPADTVDIVDTTPTDTEPADTVGSVNITPPVFYPLPDVLTEEVESLPHENEAVIMRWSFNGANGIYFFYNSGLDSMEFYCVENYGFENSTCYKLTLTLPDGYSNGKIHKAETTSGSTTSDGMQFIVEAFRKDEKVFLNYTFSANKKSGTYVLTSVKETTEEEFTPVLGERTLEFVPHELYLRVGVTISLKLPSYWYLNYTALDTTYFHEDDILNILPMDKEITRACYRTTDRDFDTILADLAGDTNPIGNAIFAGTTAAGHTYKGVCQMVEGASRYIFSVVTDCEMYTLEVWSWPEYDDGLDFVNDVVIPVVESFSVKYHEEVTITDIADWDSLPWVEEPKEDRKRGQEAYNFIYDMVSGESKYPELNGLGIEDYSITLLENSSAMPVFRFTFTVTGNSLPETLPPGTYTKIICIGMYLDIYDDKKPETAEDYAPIYNVNYGLDKFGNYTAVQAVHRYLSIMWWEISPYGEWDITNGVLPSNYICTYYGNENFEISFDAFAGLLYEKFGISFEKPTEDCRIYRCAYNSATDTVRYDDTRSFIRTHRFVDVEEADGITYVTVQFYADRLYLIPSHKIVYKIGEGDVFLGYEVIDQGNYTPNSISW